MMFLVGLHVQRLVENWAVRYAEQWTYIALVLGEKL